MNGGEGVENVPLKPTAMGTTAGTVRLIDVSHTIENELITYRGLPAPVICDYLSREESRRHYAPGTEFAIHKIELVGNTGTYLDSPFHRYEHGRDLAAVPWRRSPTWRGSWSARSSGSGGQDGRSTEAPSRGLRCGGRLCWCTRGGTGTGGRTGTSRGTHT